MSSDNFVVQDVTREPRIIAEVDFDSAPSTLHEKAVYILEGRTYFVEKYDHQERRAHVREAEVDYYTDAITYTKVRILDRFAEEAAGSARRSHGEVHVTSQVVGFKKIKFHTNENVGSGELQMPENEMHTTSYWLTRAARGDGARCPSACEERRDGVVALSYTLGQLAALFLMCDRHDLGVALGDNGQGEARVERGLRRLRRAARAAAPAPGDDYEPQVFIYDNYPGGIGLSEPLYRLHDRLLAESLRADRRLRLPRRLPVVRRARWARWAAAARRSRSPSSKPWEPAEPRCASPEPRRRRASVSVASAVGCCSRSASAVSLPDSFLRPFLSVAQECRCVRPLAPSCSASPRTAGSRTSGAAGRCASTRAATRRRAPRGEPGPRRRRRGQRFLIDATPDLPRRSSR